MRSDMAKVIRERDYIDCTKYWVNREIESVELMKKFDDLKEEGLSFTQALDQRFNTSDVIFGKKLCEQLFAEREERLKNVS